MTDFPAVAVWEYAGSNVWQKVGQIGSYSTLTFTPTFLDAGMWSMTLPYDAAALSIVPGRLVTIDWRGVRSTWLIDNPRFFQQPSEDGSDPGGPQVQVTGGGALAMLGWCLCWPDATKPIEIQPIWRSRDAAPYIGPAEQILRKMVSDNFRDRYAAPIVLEPNLARGTTVRLRPNFDNLFELVQSNAKRSGIGVDIGLVNTDATHAQLTLHFWTPDDVSKSVRLSTKLKSVTGWEQNDTAPSATKAYVGTGDTKSVRTTLAADLTAGANTLTVASSADFPTLDSSAPSFRVTIGGESLSVTNVSGKTWTVTRGYGSTTAAAHDSGDRVSLARTYTVVTTDASNAAAAYWGGHREVYVDGPASNDTAEITDSGKASLSDGAETRALSVTAAEPVGMQAFTRYQVGDVATAEVATGATATANISAIAVAVDPEVGISVTPVFGEPTSVNSSLRIANLIRGIRRDVQQLKRS